MVRSYDDPCGLARALNLVGDRWALLVVRELLLGPKRFTELRRGLPGASQSMLTSRLTEMEEAAVVRRRRLGPPASAWAYELTEWGREIEPALIQLSRWGSRSPQTSSAELGADALALALKTTFDPDAAGDSSITCELRMDGDNLYLTVHNGQLAVTRTERNDADLVIEAGAGRLRALVFGNAAPRPAEIVRGDRAAATHLFGLFRRPVPVD